MTRTDPQFPFDEQLPEELRRALASLDGPGPQVPREIDATILSEAKAGFLRRRRFWLVARFAGGIAAAAAVVLIALHLFVPGDGSNRSAVATNHRLTLTEAADINHDGRVDILDAYILAQKISRHEPLDPAWDLNGDGVVDQKDVDLIAGIAVQTSEPEAAR
jgi:hypothetical protein